MLIITDTHVVMKEVRQWGIQGVITLVELPSIEGFLEVKPVFKVLQLQRVLQSFAFYAILLRDILSPVGQCRLIKVRQHNLALGHGDGERLCMQAL